MIESYESAHPCERWVLEDGTKVWINGECPECSLPMATTGNTEWCTGGCESQSRALAALGGGGNGCG